jgi:hypothetical protein
MWLKSEIESQKFDIHGLNATTNSIRDYLARINKTRDYLNAREVHFAFLIGPTRDPLVIMKVLVQPPSTDGRGEIDKSVSEVVVGPTKRAKFKMSWNVNIRSRILNIDSMFFSLASWFNHFFCFLNTSRFWGLCFSASWNALIS